MSTSSSSSPEITTANTTDPQERFSYKLATFDEAIEELTSRFILNLPDEELASPERICFQVEQAHWFYEDFIREQNPKFPSFPLKKFSAILFEACPLLHRWAHDHEQAFEHFMLYKTRVPVCGAIMLNESWDKCILVKGWKSSSGWGFPKGKINEEEREANCAVREVLEETGFNLAGRIDEDNKIEMTIKQQRVILYIVPGIPEGYPFKTKTRKEISKIEWFKLSDLPTWKRSKAAPGKFYLISPFIGPLKAFIHDRKPRNVSRKLNKQPSRASPQPALVSQASSSSFHDANQESSSQSSSADAGEPSTPSPQYTEPVVQETSTSVEIVLSLDSEPIDPHFARLLSALTVSGASKDESSAALSNSQMCKEESRPSEGLTSSSHANTPAYDFHSSVGPSHIPHVTSSHTSSSLYTSAGEGSSERGQQLSPPSATAPAPSPDVPRRLTSRRTSSTADISPYLTKPAEVPTSAKRLRQLALLEAIADESARMTPNIFSRMDPTTVYPHPSPSVPPPTLYDPRIIYSSNHGVRPFVAPMHTNTPPPPPLPARSASVHDPFQVRPRPTHSFHHAGHAPGPSGLSMNQSQLLALINQPLPPSHPPHAQMQSHSVIQRPFTPVGHPPLPIFSQAIVPPPHSLPPSNMGPMGPMSAPALSPHFDLPMPPPSRQPVNSNLLSILNGTSQPSNIPA